MNTSMHSSINTRSGAWNELVSAALVGIDRRAFVPDAPLSAGVDPARALLGQAMVLAIPVLTGTSPAQYEGALPEPAPADERPLISRAAQLRLRAVLDVYPKYLGEYLDLVRASGRRVPSPVLPGLLGRGPEQRADTRCARRGARRAGALACSAKP